MHTRHTLLNFVPMASLAVNDEDNNQPESSFAWTRQYVLPKLLQTYVPERLIGLEQQLKTIKLHIIGTARHGLSSTILVRGLRGSGKTHLISAAITQAIRELNSSSNTDTHLPNIIRADAASTDPLQLCTMICCALDEKFDSTKRIAKYLLMEKAIELLIAGTPIILVIENIDNYLESGSFLYKLFDLCHSETRVLCIIYTTRTYKFVSSIPMRVQSRFLYDLVDTMQNLSLPSISTSQNLKEMTQKANVCFLKQFIQSRLTIPIVDNSSSPNTCPEPLIKRTVDNKSMPLLTELPGAYGVHAWNAAIEEILSSSDIEDTLSWITSLTRDCYLYVQLTLTIYLSFIRCNKPSVEEFNRATSLYLSSSYTDKQMQALKNLSNEACYLLGAIVSYCKYQNSLVFTLSDAIKTFSSGKGTHLSEQMYQLMQASVFELADGKLIAKRQGGWRLVVPMIKVLEFSKYLPESVRIIF